MIDTSKISKEIDKLFENETPESLNKFLEDQRKNVVYSVTASFLDADGTNSNTIGIYTSLEAAEKTQKWLEDKMYEYENKEPPCGWDTFYSGDDVPSDMEILIENWHNEMVRGETFNDCTIEKLVINKLTINF